MRITRNGKLLVVILITWLFIFSLGNTYGQIKTSLFLAGNTASESPIEEQNEFIHELTRIKHPYSFLYLGNFSTYNEKDDDLEFSFYPEDIKDKDAALLFAMGPNEWRTGKRHVKEVIDALHDKFDNNSVYTTDWGCPGPTEIELTEHLTVILIDTYWWLNTDDVRFGKCGIDEERDVFVWLQDALRRNENKTVIVAGHHPIESYGPHGGHLPMAVNILGFPYAIYKNLIGDRSDLVHPEYKNLADQLRVLLKQFPNVIYASAHENSMQYIQLGDIHQIISGSLQKQSFVNTKNTEFGSSEAGISRLDIYENGDVVLNFFAVNKGVKEPAFTKKIFTKEYVTRKEVLAERKELFKEPTAMAYASKRYLATERYEKWMGKNYRDVWATPIEARVFDITKEHGGLEILKRGGGQQTKSVRLQDGKEKQYVLRSVEKYAEGAVPDEMKKTFAKDIVQDQISASNPYAALPAAVLAEKSGVFHTNPEVVFVPPDPLFRHYQEDMKSGLFLYEERPAGSRRDVNSFGNSKKIISTDDVISKTTESEDHQIDQYAVLRARLLDIYINDWDRHDDQWRWASFKRDDKTVYLPIPRDRDQAFFVNQGILPGIASKDFILPKIQNFQPRTKNVIGLGFNARYFDRTFLTQMEWKDWRKTTADLMKCMTEEVIDEAMAAFPKEVQSLCADTIKSVLMARKKYMDEMANELYLVLARKVNVIGTEKSDLFKIERKNNHETEVNVWHIKKNGTLGKNIFKRTFYTQETKEIICYGLDGEDKFEISGGVNFGPIIRIIGGPDKDVISDYSLVGGIGKRNKIYDLRKSTVIENGKESRRFLSNKKIVHEYNRKAYKDNVAMPLASLGYDADDGIFLGYGRTWFYQRFRREWRSSILGDYAIRTSAFDIKYKFESLSTNNGLDYILGIDVSGPNYTNNYYGIGNNTVNTYEGKNYKYFQTRQRRYLAGIGVQKRFGKTVWEVYEDDETEKDRQLNEHQVGIALKWNLTNTREQEDKFITNFEENGLTSSDLLRKQFVIVNVNYQYKNVNREYHPSRGIVVNAKAEQFINVEGNNSDFTKMGGSVISYLSFKKYPRTIYAFRLGGEKIFGDYFFRNAAILDGKTNLRGYRQTRFYGDASIYFNAEARIKLHDFKNYLITGEIGLLVFDDIGRVWFDGEKSNKWHNGYGAGIWVSPFKMATLASTLNFSKEETLVQFKFSYLF